MNLASRSGNPLAGAIAAATRENRVGAGLGANPILPPGVGSPGTGMPHLNLSGMAENTGALPPPLAGSFAKIAAAAGGMKPPRGGPRGIEKPSVARDNAISRRLNGNPSRGSELKGL